MSTLPNAAPVPSTPVPSIPVRPAPLTADAFTRSDLAEIRDAGGIFAAALADIAHHHIGDPGSWDVYGDATDELARLHAALDQMTDAICDTRGWLTAIEHRVRGRVTAAAAAALARTVVKLRRLDPALIAPHVVDPVDLRAVLGRGRWLPTMTRHVPAPPAGPVDLAALLPPAIAGRPGKRPRRVVRRVGPQTELPLFADNKPAKGGGDGCR